MCMQKLFNLAVSSKTIRHAHSTLEKAISYAQKIEREFLLVEGIQQTRVYMVESIDAAAGNDPMRQQRLASLTCYKCSQKAQYRNDCPSSAGTSPVLDKTLTVPMYSLPTAVMHIVTASYALPQSSLVTIPKEAAKEKQANLQFRKSVQNIIKTKTYSTNYSY